ncbi:MAG: hypothetical protein IPH75_11215 [bacterium]|nr:hypothetical protein [bacterium]
MGKRTLLEARFRLGGGMDIELYPKDSTEATNHEESDTDSDARRATLVSGNGSRAGLLEKKIDSLFVIASSGEGEVSNRWSSRVEDSIAALGADAVPIIVGKLETKSPRERLAIINILKRSVASGPYLLRALRI